MAEPVAGARADGQLVTFAVGDEEYGFDIMAVQEIIRPPALARVPGAPPCVDGIANLRGVTLPVVDVRTRFGLPRAPDTDRTRVLVVEHGGRRTGLRVDHVRQVTRVTGTAWEPPPAVLAHAAADCLEGVVKLDEGRRLVFALRADRLGEFTSGDAVADGTPAAARRAAGATGGPAAATDTTALVTVQLGGGEYAFPMERVREILRAEPPTPLPDAPPAVLGVVTVRGEVLPVIDTARALGAGAHDGRLRDDQRIVVADVGGTALGFVVDRVHEVLAVAAAAITPPPAVAGAGAAVAGLVQLDEGRRVVLVVAVDRLVAEHGLAALAGERAAAPEAAAARGGTAGGAEQFVTFLVGEEEFAVPIGQVREIDRCQRVTDVPGAPPHVRGVTNLRGEIVPVVDARATLGLPPQAPDERSRILILDAGGDALGVLVDAVREVRALPSGQLQPRPPQLDSAADARRVVAIGVVPGRDRMLLVVEAAAFAGAGA
ncbi:MAG: chemotaxis protein CheW [Gemmatimonadales bacterium]|nr:chemotaxis protein CheW [Gemmatimonadales bacterium]